MSIEEREKMNDVILKYLGRTHGQGCSLTRWTSTFIIGKDEGYELVEYLRDNYPEYYKELSFKNGIETIENAIHEDWGEGGYLPFFSDKPDYYYIHY